MELLKLAGVFCVMILVLWRKKPLSWAVAAAALAVWLLFWMPARTFAAALVRGAVRWDTIQLLLVLYLITFLQRMLEKRGCLTSAKDALDGLFNSRRVDASAAPALLGMLPAVGTVLICGDIVRQSTDGFLKTEEQACVTSYYRHVSELFFPTYTSILIAVDLSAGKVSVGGFTLAMLPMLAVLMAIGWLFYLRRIPKDAGFFAGRPKAFYWKLLLRSLWTIIFTVILIVAFGVPVHIAVLACIVCNLFVGRFGWKELRPFFASAFEARLMISTLLIMMFKEVLAAAGVISALPAFFSSLPVPPFLVFALIFFFGSVAAGSQAIIVLCMGMAMAAAAQGGLALFVLLMCMAYAAMQLSPVHVCLAVCAEDYRISLGTLIRKTVPLVGVFCLAAFGYYGLLRLFGF
ncbi:DUF401 family protein [Anaerotruncus colihominis]|uniref:DUF401 family protein n=1 Tax=Anaerotruncus colihominis TaxID=169435 RepID=UPI000B3893B9|nr:DUF401 family protein [Anaerotruncus colihominis]OUO66548.1 hypothetical protein B5F55_13355 [Anaerotruncus colihominis]UOX66425.1 DUF401 family protein [Anaerotruncus colihominis]HJF54991.1 DUF401 family protein [Anaerotruncus colihominis]